MKQRRRIYYSAAQRSEIWNRWQAGWGGAFRHSICGEFSRPSAQRPPKRGPLWISSNVASTPEQSVGPKSRAVRPVRRIGEINEHMFEPR